jgi:hypothetical protein
MYALLGDGAPVITNESLASDLKHFFRNEEAFSLQIERMPFTESETLALRWRNWFVRVCYEEGENVVQDSIYISQTVGSTAPYEISGISKRIRVVFGDDDTREYTNQIICLMDFLREIPTTVIFDPQQKNLVK